MPTPDLHTANSHRQASAAARAVANTRTALATLGDAVPEPMLHAAYLRLLYPDASLRDLGERSTPPMSKHAIAGQLRRLNTLATTAPAASNPC